MLLMKKKEFPREICAKCILRYACIEYENNKNRVA